MFPLEEENVNAPVPPLLGYMTALFIVPVIFGNCPFVVVPMYDPAVPATTLPSVNVGKLNVRLSGLATVQQTILAWIDDICFPIFQCSGHKIFICVFQIPIT